MPLLIRELNIKVNVGETPAGDGAPASPGGSGGGASTADAQALLQRVVEEVMRIEAARKER